MAFLSRIPTKASFALAVLLLQAVKTQGFLAAAPAAQRVPSLSLKKPTAEDIERAAGQLTKDSKTAPEYAAIQGLPSKSPRECCTFPESIEKHPELKEKLEKLMAPRPYPLFLMEKAAKYLIDDVFNSDTKSDALPNGDKERIVVLGAGWVSAAFLQKIDNDRYDVTVISPRNFFVFTPMLAGASVGTVDVRSITQPIREVSVEFVVESESV